MDQKDLFTREDLTGSLDAAFKWWERKRLLYNIIILPVIFLCILDYMIHNYGKFPFRAVLEILAIGISANFFYFAGFAFEWFMVDCFKSENDFSGWRKPLFWLGIIFSIFGLLIVFFLAEFLS
jgi:hypothetical protein